MICQKCGGQTVVRDSRPNKIDGLQFETIRRRRRCLQCGERFSTHEVPIKKAQEMSELQAKLDEITAGLRAALQVIHEIEERLE